MKSDEDYTFPIKSLQIIYSGDQIENIQIQDDIIFSKVENITEGRNIKISYIPKFELIPSTLSEDKLNKLEKIIKERI